MVNNIPVNGWPQLKDLEAVQPILNRLDKIEAWKRTVKEETFTGDDITIENALALPARSLITEINAIQDLHGQSAPYVGGTYKNKLPMTVSGIKALNTTGTWSGNVYTWNGNTFEILTDSANNVLGIKVGGTNNGTACRFQVCDEGFIGDGSYYLNGSSTDFSGGQTQLYTKYSASSYAVSYNGADAPFTVSSGYTIGGVYILVDANISFSSPIIYRPMIRLATESDTSFAPYSNICPISGRDSVAVDDTGKNQVETPSATVFAARGITLTTADNGETTLNGTSTAGSIDGDTFELPAGTYTISVGTKLPSGIWISLDGVGGAMISPTGQSISFTTTEAISTFTHIYVNAGVAFNNFKLNWMLEEGSTATAYEPYAHSSATIQLGTTVYGADINWDTGVMTVDRVKVSKTWGQMDNATDLDSGVTRKLCNKGSIGTLLPMSAESISNVCAYFGGGWNDPVIRWFHDETNAFFYLPSDTPSDLVCEWLAPLATPTTIQLTPTQLEMLKGYNHITLSDGYGTIELKALTGANWS